MALSRVLGMAAVAGAALADQCDVEPGARSDCGVLGTTQGQCDSQGCCWRPAGDGAPWCFHPSGGPSPAPAPQVECKLAYTSQGAPFSEEEQAKVRSYFLANVDLQGSGAVVAAPDHNTGPGGDYYFHWERDAALSYHALLFTSNLTDVNQQMQDYVQWVLKVQNQDDPNNIDVRTEPKYTIPDGRPFMGGWCRPQTDGPGLRAKTLAEYGLKLLEQGNRDYVQNNLWTTDGSNHGGAVRYNLDWVVTNWQQNGCDLWEEINSNDFFWGRYTMRAGLHLGAELASKMGDAEAAERYRSAKADIEKTLMSHYDGNFVFESQSRKKDAAVIEAFNVGDLNDNVFPALGKEVLGTVITLNDLFCKAYDINRKDSAAGVPGILYGRYEGDNYDGGNPWVLLSASLALLLYRQAADVLQLSGALGSDIYSMLQQAYGIDAGLSTKLLAEALMGAGDGVMLRIKKHVQAADLHMQEQLSRSDGSQSSARDLTWNYANMLKAFAARKALAERLTDSEVANMIVV